MSQNVSLCLTRPARRKVVATGRVGGLGTGFAPCHLTRVKESRRGRPTTRPMAFCRGSVRRTEVNVASNPQRTTLVAAFEDRSRAERAVDELERVGFNLDQI